MGMMTRRITIYKEEGYVISNANVRWETMPTRENITRPALRINHQITNSDSDIKKYGVFFDDIDKYVELSEVDEIEMDPDFKANYLDALHGCSSVWKLMAIRILKDYGVTFAFVNTETGLEEDLYLRTPTDLKFTVEKDHKDGTTDRYLVSLSSNDRNEQDYIGVTEYFPHGEHTITLKGFLFETECPDEQWDYAYVSEER